MKKNIEDLHANTKELKFFLDKIKKNIEEKEGVLGSNGGFTSYVFDTKKEIFPKLDKYFDDIWNLTLNLNDQELSEFRKYYVKELYDLLGEGVETNLHIREKPLGYGGDFITMNYIYDYNNGGNFLGKSLYSKFVNHYTCTIQVANSNIVRKNYFKNKILLASEMSKNVKILSIGSGSARELVELLREEKITNTVEFDCLDFEEQSIDYVKNQLEEENLRSTSLKINFILTNLIKLIKDKGLREELAEKDFIYASGVFDYLSDRLCQKLTEILVKMLNKNGELILVNMSLENQKHRAYYELFGEWNMYHRSREEVEGWFKNIKEEVSYEVEVVKNCPSYHFIRAQKK